jgi:hypothetical protein
MLSGKIIQKIDFHFGGRGWNDFNVNSLEPRKPQLHTKLRNQLIKNRLRLSKTKFYTIFESFIQ